MIPSHAMTTAVFTGSATTYYASFIFNVSPFNGGNGSYAGIAVS